MHVVNGRKGKAMHWETVWQFNTANYRVALEIAPEEMDPADSFEFAEDIAAVRNGNVEWFVARVSIYVKTEHGEVRLGCDVLGGCAYETVREFYTSHRDPDPMCRNSSIMRAKNGGNMVICHYFPSMVAVAIKDARANAAAIHLHH